MQGVAGGGLHCGVVWRWRWRGGGTERGLAEERA